MPTRKVCLRCVKEKGVTREYYKSMSDLWGNIDDRMPICKDCIIEMYDNYLTKDKLGIRSTVISVCRKLDIFYSDDIYESTIEDNKKKVGTPFIVTYINKVNLVLSNKKEVKAFDDSDIDEIKNLRFQTGTGDGFDLTPEQYSKLVAFWGEDVYDTKAELIRLQNMYEDFLKNYSNDYVKRQFFKLLSIEYLRLEKTKSPKDRKDITYNITTLTDKANLSPKDTEQNKQDDDDKILGMMAKKIESEEPIDYGVVEKAAYADYRGYKKYIEEYLYKPVKKAFGVE